MNYAEEMEAFWKAELEEFDIADVVKKLKYASNADLARLRKDMLYNLRDSTLKRVLTTELYTWYRALQRGIYSYSSEPPFTKEERVKLRSVLGRVSFHSGIHFEITKTRKQEREEESMMPAYREVSSSEFFSNFSGGEIRFLDDVQAAPIPLHSATMTGRIRSDRPSMEPISPGEIVGRLLNLRVQSPPMQRANAENVARQGMAAENIMNMGFDELERRAILMYRYGGVRGNPEMLINLARRNGRDTVRNAINHLIQGGASVHSIHDEILVVYSREELRQFANAFAVDPDYLPPYSPLDAEFSFNMVSEFRGITHEQTDPVRAEESPAERVIRHNRERGEQRMGFNRDANRHSASQSAPTHR